MVKIFYTYKANLNTGSVLEYALHSQLLDFVLELKEHRSTVQYAHEVARLEAGALVGKLKQRLKTSFSPRKKLKPIVYLFKASLDEL
ncbi:hypothetical protein RIF29_16847 [Crotalaria pallida]|uniref:Uncharacterized protein n=1 Tax=Crotalaria pallida TaxID=3830 RepID=A0AAN9IFX5_CROPI